MEKNKFLVVVVVTRLVEAGSLNDLEIEKESLLDAPLGSLVSSADFIVRDLGC